MIGVHFCTKAAAPNRSSVLAVGLPNHSRADQWELIRPGSMPGLFYFRRFLRPTNFRYTMAKNPAIDGIRTEPAVARINM